MNDLASGRLKFAGYRIGETYCLSPSNALLAVDAVPNSIVQVPGTKPWLLGAAKLGRDLIPFVNIGRLLAIPKSGGEKEQGVSTVLFVKGNTEVGSVGVVVDEVLCFIPSGALRDVPSSELKIPPGLGACLSGAVTDGTRTWALIDIQALIANPTIQKIDLT